VAIGRRRFHNSSQGPLKSSRDEYSRPRQVYNHVEVPLKTSTKKPRVPTQNAIVHMRIQHFVKAPNVTGDVAVHSHVREDLPTASLNVDMAAMEFSRALMKRKMEALKRSAGQIQRQVGKSDTSG